MPLLLALIALAASPTPAEAPPTFRLPADVRPVSYSLSLDLDPKQEGYSGTETIRVQLDRPRKELWLHGLGLEVLQATVGGRKATWTQTNDEGLAVLRLDAPVPAGAVDVVLSWRQKFNARLASVYKVTAEGSAYVFTQFEAISAREGFPCFDEPGFKTPWSLSVTVAEGDQVVSNSPEASRKKAGAKTRVTFQPTAPLPAYLLAFAVGPLDLVQGPTLPPTALRKSPLPIRGVAVRGQGPKLKDSLEVAGQALLSLENYFGLAYPYGKMDLVAVPDFAAGAMENAGLVTFRDSVLFVAPGASIELQRDAVATIAHEFAHQWFGDLVTLAWWDDIWLNEAFASFMETPIVDELRPALRAKASQEAGTDWIMGEDSLVSARQIRQPVVAKGDILKAFDGITYTKGAAVISMFERWVGTDAFKRGVHDYLVAHANGTTTAADLLSALSAASGKDVATPFSTFLDRPGIPYLEAKLVCDAAKKTAVVELAQARFLPVGSTGVRSQLWQLPVCVRADGASACTLLTSATGSLALTTCPKLLHPNLDAGGYYRWSLPPAQLKALSAGLAGLTSGERLSFSNALRGALATGTTEFAQSLESASPLALDPEPAVASTPLSLLRFAHDNLVTPAARPKVKQRIAALYQPVLKRLTLKPKENEDPGRRELRTLALTALAEGAEEPKTLAGLAKLGRAVLGPEGDKQLHLDAAPADQVGLALNAAVVTGGDGVFDEVAARLGTLSDSSERRYLIHALASVRDPHRSAKALALTLDPRLKTNEVVGPLRGLAEDPRTRDAAWAWTQANYPALVAKLPEDWGSDVVTELFAGFCAEEKAKELEAFFAPKRASTPGLELGLAQLLESVRLCVARKAAHQQSAQKVFGK